MYFFLLIIFKEIQIKKFINIQLFIFISIAFSNNAVISQKEKLLVTKKGKNFNFLVDDIETSNSSYNMEINNLISLLTKDKHLIIDVYQQSILPFKDKRNMDMKDLRMQFRSERKKLRKKYGIIQLKKKSEDFNNTKTKQLNNNY